MGRCTGFLLRIQLRIGCHHERRGSGECAHGGMQALGRERSGGVAS